MASSRDTQNGPDFLDVLNSLNETESDLECRIVFEMKLQKRRDKPSLLFTATAHPFYSINGDQRQSVSVSATCDTVGSGLGVAAMWRLLTKLNYEASRVWATKQV